jgi:hypothetical protein
MVKCQVSMSISILSTFYLSVNFSSIVFKVPLHYPLFYLQSLLFLLCGKFIPLYLVLLKAIMFHFSLKAFPENLNKSPIRLIQFLMMSCKKKLLLLLGIQIWKVYLLLISFIAFLLTSYSSFGRYEEISNLKIEDIYHEDEGFVLTFKKRKSYQYGESHIGVLSNLPRLKVQSS